MIEPGQVFGKWTVLAPAGKDANCNKLYRVRCECTRESLVMGGMLRAGRSSACRHCAGAKNLIVARAARRGKKFGARHRGL